MPGLLIIAHAPLASALKQVAAHTYDQCAGLIEAFDVVATMPLEEIEANAGELLARVRNPNAIIFTDVLGATPCNVAQRLAAQADGGQVKVIAGVNVPMLWRSLCYVSEPLDALVERAVAGGQNGVSHLTGTPPPQNQTRKPLGHDQNHHQHQQ